MRRWMWLLLMCTVAASGQTKRPKPHAAANPPNAAANPDAFPLEKITVNGNKVFRSEQIAAVLRLKPGQLVAKADFEAARDRLLATGDFEDAAYQFQPSSNMQGYDASFEVTEVAIRYPIVFEDLGVPENVLRTCLAQRDPLYSGQIAGTKAAIARYTAFVQDCSAQPGAQSKITGKLTPEVDQKMAYVFRPEGQLPVTSFVAFKGNKVIPTTTLQNTMLGVAVGVPYKESRLRELLDASIRPLYEAKGYLRVSFPTIETQAATDVKGVRVTVTVVEGAAYKLRRFTVQGGSEEGQDLLDISEIKTGGIVNFDEINHGVDRINSEMKRRGYLDSTSRLERSVREGGNSGNESVDVVVHVEPGPRYTFSALTLVGLDIYSEPVIRKIWGESPGAPFNPEYPDYFLKSVRDQGIFEKLGKTHSEITRDDRAHTVAVTLYFTVPPAAPAAKPL